ncbi:MAG: prolipoprotein diacylglyceryl transferase, partial [Ardenticatenales bacterium]|nr:prolipoprotein diacylglyceryl transferase [Ardenticatenales bacterium]
IGGGMALALWAWWGRYPGWKLADLMALGLCFGGAVVWVAALRQGIAYGRPQMQGALAHSLPDWHGLAVLRWPVQEVGAIAFLLLGIVLLILHLRVTWPSGVLALLALWAMHLILFVLGFFRDDPTILVGTFRLGQLLSLLWLGAAALFLPARWQKKEAAR